MLNPPQNNFSSTLNTVLMSYVRRRSSVHFNINGYRIRKDAFWRWLTGSSMLLLLVLIAIVWTVYSKDMVVHQTASKLLSQLMGH